MPKVYILEKFDDEDEIEEYDDEVEDVEDIEETSEQPHINDIEDQPCDNISTPCPPFQYNDIQPFDINLHVGYPEPQESNRFGKIFNSEKNDYHVPCQYPLRCPNLYARRFLPNNENIHNKNDAIFHLNYQDMSNPEILRQEIQTAKKYIDDFKIYLENHPLMAQINKDIKKNENIWKGANILEKETDVAKKLLDSIPVFQPKFTPQTNIDLSKQINRNMPQASHLQTNNIMIDQNYRNNEILKQIKNAEIFLQQLDKEDEADDDNDDNDEEEEAEEEDLEEMDNEEDKKDKDDDIWEEDEDERQNENREIDMDEDSLEDF